VANQVLAQLDALRQDVNDALQSLGYCKIPRDNEQQCIAAVTIWLINQTNSMPKQDLASEIVNELRLQFVLH
jgi:hypothetical protein